jgi:hypothetical protein
LTPTISNRAADRISWRGTSSGVLDCQAGSCTAMPAPSKNVKTSSNEGGIRPANVNTSSETPATRKYTWTANSNQRLSKESANTPAGIANNITGTVFASRVGSATAPTS